MFHVEQNEIYADFGYAQSADYELRTVAERSRSHRNVC